MPRPPFCRLRQARVIPRRPQPPPRLLEDAEIVVIVAARNHVSDSHIPNGLAVFFTITTLVVFFYPIIKLTPSWLERRMAKSIALHRSAIIVLDQAVAATTDVEHRARLEAQRDHHRGIIDKLMPGDAAAGRAAAARFDEAA
jgi:hypothetical protein